MTKKLLSLMLSLAFVFLFAGISIAAAKADKINSSKALDSISVAKSNMLSRNTSIAKYKKLMQSCETSMGWDCSSALDHFSNVIATTTSMCDGSGWGSQTCSDYIAWQGATLDWAISICNGNYAIVKAKPQKVIVNDYAKREVFGQLVATTN